MIPIARPDLGREEADAVAEVLASGMIVQGRRVRELEGRWAETVGVRHAIAMSNGTVALMSILVNRDTKIIVQGLTGKTGTFHTEQALAYYGTKMVAGTHPKKGGEFWTGDIARHDRLRLAYALWSVLSRRLLEAD